jgi:hypothetical protein
MENLKLKSLFFFDPTLKSEKRKPSEEEAQDAKLLFYYPNNEDIHIKRSNAGIIEGSIGFFDTFQKTEDDDFLISELNNFYYISNKFEENKYIVFLLQKVSTDSYSFSFSQNLQVKKSFLKILLKNFYETLVLFHNRIDALFEIQPNNDIRKNTERYDNLVLVLTDFVESFFDSLVGNKLPFLDHLLYFPLNEHNFSQLLLNSMRLSDKFQEIKYISLFYKGYLLHNEVSIDIISILYNIFFSNIDTTYKFPSFPRPNTKLIQTIPSQQSANDSLKSSKNSSFRKCFEINNSSNYLVGISKLNINTYQYFIPTLYFNSSGEKVKLIIYYHDGLILFLFLNENFNLQNKLNQLIKLEKYISRYFKEDILSLEKLFLQKTSRIELNTFFYLNNSNRSLKLSGQFLNKMGRGLESDQYERLIYILKFLYNNKGSSLTFYNNKLAYFNSSLDRKFVMFYEDLYNSISQQIEDSKREVFDRIFIL